MSRPTRITDSAREVDFSVERSCQTSDVVAACLRKITALNRLFALEVCDAAWGRSLSQPHHRSC